MRRWSGRILEHAHNRRGQAGRGLLRLLALGCLLIAGCGEKPPATDCIVLITIDTLRADRLGCYGYIHAETPVLDSLAAESLLFERAYSPYPLTLPSHASLLTGQLPFAHGLRNNDVILRADSEPMLQEILAEKGFATAGVVAAFVLDGRFGLSRGFHRYVDDFSPDGPQERRADAVTNIALRLLDDLGDRPFFLWVHYFDPHAPYAVGADSPLEGYDREITLVDTQIARLLEALKAKGLYNRAALAVVGDHGEAFGEHGEQEHGFFVYDVTLHVPLLLKLPQRQQAGTRRPENVCITDLFPTLLRLAGVDPPKRPNARDLLAPGDEKERILYAETLSPFVNHGASPLVSSRKGRWKYIEAPLAELYDTQNDAGESENLHDNLPGRVADLRADLVAINDLDWLTSPDPFQQIVTDQATQERLATLGYVSGGARRASGRRPDPKLVLAAQVEIDRGDRAVYRGELAEAETAYRSALQMIPGDWKAAWKLGNLLQDRGEVAGAAEVYRQVLEIDPGNLNARLRLARSWVDLGRAAEALHQLKICLEGAPEHPPVHLARAEALHRLGRTGEALVSLRTALRLDPDNTTARDLLQRWSAE